MAGITKKELTDQWAYDISKGVIEAGEVYDIDVINQSIELILGTMYGERLFNPFYGCNLYSYLFEALTQERGEDLLNDIIGSIKRWEDRITILETDCRVVVNTDQNSIILVVPYIINRTQVTSIFKKKIINS